MDRLTHKIGNFDDQVTFIFSIFILTFSLINFAASHLDASQIYSICTYFSLIFQIRWTFSHIGTELRGTFFNKNRKWGRIMSQLEQPCYFSLICRINIGKLKQIFIWSGVALSSTLEKFLNPHICVNDNLSFAYLNFAVLDFCNYFLKKLLMKKSNNMVVSWNSLVDSWERTGCELLRFQSWTGTGFKWQWQKMEFLNDFIRCESMSVN
jgi:hypothetical protein